MQVTETTSEGLKREFTIVVPAADIENEMAARLAELAQSVRVPGFRPGKVPLELLRKRYGDSVRGEVLEKTIQDSTANAITENGIRPAMQPRVEIVNFSDGADLEYKVAVELLPEIEPVDFSKLALERLVAEVGDEEIKTSLDRFAESRKTYEAPAKARPAESGDQAVIDFLGRIDGEEFEGGAANDFVLELGSNRFIPGFEDQLIGANAGDSIEVKLDFPDDYAAENVRGKAAVFAVEVKELREPKPVEIDDELAKSMGLDDIAALRAAVREQIEREYTEFSRARLKRKLLDELSDAHDFAVPPGMVEQEFETIWGQVKDAKENDRLDDDDKEKSDEELEARYRGIAERRVRLGLLLSEVGRTNNISVNQDDINRAMAEQARRFSGQESQIVDYYQKNPEALQELQAPIFEDKVVDFVVAMAEITDRIVPIDQLFNEAMTAESATAAGIEGEN